MPSIMEFADFSNFWHGRQKCGGNRLPYAIAAFALVATLLLPLAVRAQDVDARADDTQPAGGDVNAANNPLTRKITINLQNYFLPSINRLGNQEANQFLLRGVIPSDAFAVPQLFRFTLPVATNPAFPSGSVTGLGDLTLFDLFVIPTKPVVFAVGPLLVAPAATSPNTGSGKWQAGAAGGAVAPQSWGVLAGLVTYQHSFAGDASRPTTQVITAQPIITYNLLDGFYLRSSGVMTFDEGKHTTTVPVGFGVGKVWSLGKGNTINVFVEPQYSVVHSGVGVAIWQIFTGANFQIALGGP